MKKFLFVFISCLLSLFSVGQSSPDISTFPIELRYFNAERQQANGIILKWLAPCQTTEARFEVESSADAKTFTSIYSITADQDRCFQPFSFSDTRLLSGKTYYRIRLITPSNQSIYSYTIPVVSKGGGFDLNSLWPSQVSSIAVLNFSSGIDEEIRFSISDMNGRRLQTFTRKITPGNHQVVLDLGKFGSGYYVLQAINNNNEKRILRFQKL